MIGTGSSVAVSTLAPGARVVVRDEEWLVRRVDALPHEGYSVHVTGLSELVRNHNAIFLTTLDAVQEMRPEETRLVVDDSPLFRRSRLYLESLFRRTPPTDPGIYLGHLGVMDQKQFQLRPAHMALKALRPRILIADGVGLGKTLEVGILLAELIKRGRGERIMVVALKSLLAQFQQELWSRFAIPLVRLDSVGIQRIRNKIPANRNPFTYYNRVIISVDTLKDDGRYRHYLEQCHWDAVVVDECHNVANEGTLRHILADRLAQHCDALIFTSATPHNGKPESFANLMNMLEPTAIADPQNYEDTDIKGLYVRRFKVHVAAEFQDDFRDRNIDLIPLPASPPEEAVLDRLHDLHFRTLDRGAGRDALYRTTVFKAFLSSPVACIETLTNRIQRIDEQLKAHPDKSELAEDRAVIEELVLLAAAIDDASVSKYRCLETELIALGYGQSSSVDRVIVFSERIKTLEWLEERLRTRFHLTEDQVRVFHAGLPDVDQQGVVESFGKADSPIRILLASDVASEGVNLHFFCHRMFHFDIPWSLITLEQRNGRIDRIGQHHTPIIRYLLTVPNNPDLKGDTRIIERLVEKEQWAYKNIGDAAVLMGLYSARLEEERIAKAIERHDEAEAAVPDTPVEINFLELLRQGAEEDQHDDPRRDVPTLFEGDFAFVDAALNEIAPDLSENLELERDAQTESVRFYPPEDLAARLEFVPREAVPNNAPLDLSADRSRVAQAIEDARKEEGVWPRVQLLWELHPVMQWLTDKVLVRYQRHEAPVITTDRLPAHEAIFLFQGLIANKRGQPVVADWFGVLFESRRHVASMVIPSQEVLERTGFRHTLPNPGANETLVESIQSRLTGAVERAREHMLQRRRERGQELATPLRDDLRRLQGWKERSLGEIQKEEAGYRERSQLGPQHRQEVERKRREVEARWAERQRWVTMTLTTEEKPYVRLAAVFLGVR